MALERNESPFPRATLSANLPVLPITIRQSRLRSAAFLALALVFVSAIFLPQKPDDADRIWLELAIGFFGLCALLFAFQLVVPGRLVIGADGIILTLMFRTRVIRWADSKNFRIVYPSSRASTKLIGYDPIGGEPSMMGRLNRSLSGAQRAIPAGWTMKAEALADLLNAVRATQTGTAPLALADRVDPPVVSDLDRGRVEIVQSRLWPGLGLLGILAVMAFLAVETGPDREVLPWVLGFLLVVNAPLVWRVIWPDRLIIEPEGVTLIAFGFHRRMGWTYDRFRMKWFRHGFRRICYQAADGQGWPSFVAGFASFTGLGALPGGWTVPTDQVVVLLNDARARWAGKAMAGAIVR